MKHLVGTASLLAACLLTFLSGCAFTRPDRAEKEKSYVVDYDLNAVQGLMQLIFETDDSVYYLASSSPSSAKIYVSDKENKEWLPLCRKPNCLHKWTDCDAILEGDVFEKIWLYDSYIYYISMADDYEGTLSLWRMRLDGSAHEMLMEIPAPEDENYTEGGWSWMFHNRYAIVTFRGGYLGTGGELISVGKYFIIDLGSDGFEVKPLDLRAEDGTPAHLGKAVAGKKNILYSFIEDNETCTLYRTDLETGVRSSIGVLPFAPWLYACTLEGNRLIMCDGWDSGAIYEFSLETGETKVLAQAAPRTQLWHRYYKGRVYGAHYGLEGSPFATGVFELDGSPIQILDGSTYEKHMMFSFMVGDLAFGYVSGDDYVRKPPEYYLDLTKVGIDEFRWMKWGD